MNILTTFYQIWLYSAVISLLGFFFVLIENNQEEIQKYKEISGIFDYHLVMIVCSLLPFISTAIAFETIKLWICDIIIFILDLIKKIKP